MSDSKKKKQPYSSERNRKDLPFSTRQDKKNAKKQSEKNMNEPGIKTNMETDHPHRNHPKRNFKDYIYEFIMIFVAITGSFFMENMRERVVEHRKEKDYIVRLTRDIREDTTNLKYLIRSIRKQRKGLDNLAVLIEKPVSDMDTNDVKKFIILLADNLNDFNPFITRDITMSQLKSTGDLRLIKNSEVSDRIVIYYADIQYYQKLADSNEKFINESFAVEMKFIDFNRIFKTWRMDIADANNMRELGNRCSIFNIQLRAYQERLKTIYEQSTSLLKYLKEEYNLKNDTN